METLSRNTLMRKTMPELRSMIRLLGADSAVTESKESLIGRILLFTPQKPYESTPEPAKVRPKTEPTTQAQLKEAMKPHQARGLKVRCDGKSWWFCHGDRQDSGTLAMPLKTITDIAEGLLR